ncbi:MAG: hypothetical protein AAB393_02000, partial [Bacteroidota bacterium]
MVLLRVVDTFVIAHIHGLLVVWAAIFLFVVNPIPYHAFSGSDTLKGATSVGYAVVKAKPGERCIVCGTALDSNGIAFIVKGRRIPLDPAMVDDFLKNREMYFARVQPRGALFQEELGAESGSALGSGWFLFGAYVLVALIFGGLSG